MHSLQIVFASLPLLVIAGSVPVLFRRAGHPRHIQMLAGLPLLVVLFSLLGALAGEPSLSTGPQGLWITAAALLVLVFRPWPGPRQDD